MSQSPFKGPTSITITLGIGFQYMNLGWWCTHVVYSGSVEGDLRIIHSVLAAWLVRQPREWVTTCGAEREAAQSRAAACGH